LPRAPDVGARKELLRCQGRDLPLRRISQSARNELLYANRQRFQYYELEYPP